MSDDSAAAAEEAVGPAAAAAPAAPAADETTPVKAATDAISAIEIDALKRQQAALNKGLDATDEDGSSLWMHVVDRRQVRLYCVVGL